MLLSKILKSEENLSNGKIYPEQIRKPNDKKLSKILKWIENLQKFTKSADKWKNLSRTWGKNEKLL